MAIPFFEPRNKADAEMIVDQVDGHGPANNGHHPPPPGAASISIPIPTANQADAGESSVGANSIPPTHPSTTDPAEQMLAWKILAVAMCKALKEYYLQNANSKDAFTSAVVQILPNGKVQPNWK